MKKNPSWERSKNASRSSGVLSWLGSGKAVGIAFPSPEKWGGCLLQGRRPPPLLLDDDPPGHGRPVNRTLVGVGSGIPERDRVHGGVLGSVVGTSEEDVAHQDVADRVAAPAG